MYLNEYIFKEMKSFIDTHGESNVVLEKSKKCEAIIMESKDDPKWKRIIITKGVKPKWKL